MIRFTPTEKAVPKVGDVLLSEPFLDDPYFGRKAVLLCENNKDGAENSRSGEANHSGGHGGPKDIGRIIGSL